MRNINFKASTLALAASMVLAGTAHATIAGGSSSTSNVAVGTSTVNAGPHTSGKPGVAVQATGLSNLVDFAGLESVTTPDANQVYTVSDPSGIDSDHSHLGVFHFAQVSGTNIYYGEWAATSDQTAASHTVYYVGDDGGTTTVPTSGTATYSVKGINNYASASGPLSGTFTANFGSGTSGTLSGSISNATTGFGVNIGSATISGATFAGAGASATQSGSTVATNGLVSGRFYGANAAALAGLVNFASNVRYNTAFGGTKN